MSGLPSRLFDKHPILKYRVNRILRDLPVRGLFEGDSDTCSLIKDDSVVAGGYHFPCVIYLREGGDPIGKVGTSMRKERLDWISKTCTTEDPICSKNCLDVCVAFNNKASKGEQE